MERDLPQQATDTKSTHVEKARSEPTIIGLLADLAALRRADPTAKRLDRWDGCGLSAERKEAA